MVVRTEWRAQLTRDSWGRLGLTRESAMVSSRVLIWPDCCVRYPRIRGTFAGVRVKDTFCSFSVVKMASRYCRKLEVRTWSRRMRVSSQSLVQRCKTWVARWRTVGDGENLLDLKESHDGLFFTVSCFSLIAGKKLGST